MIEEVAVVENGKKIVINKADGQTETVEEVDYSINFYTRLKKDVKYYLGENYEINPDDVKILELYKEFLIINKGFTSTNTTSQLNLPKGFEIPSEKDCKTIYEKIQEVVKSGKLLDLKEVLNLAYKK